MPPKEMVIGTAGHIDHGKTSLVRALTGTDTDQLATEKSRGITIELGFAELSLPSGQQVGVIDMPGHERLIKNMLAGASGIDLALLVIAADDGVMPQTSEHLDIISLLHIPQVVVALTKIDLVEDPELLELVSADIAEKLAERGYKHAPIIPVSSTTGYGHQQLLLALETSLTAANSCRPSRAAHGVRLPIDRFFSVKGLGTIVTGTLIDGSVAVGDTLHILPAHQTTQVRGIETYHRPTTLATAGTRCALNLAATGSQSRGNTLVSDPDFPLTQVFDCQLHYLSSAEHPLKSGATVRLFWGTTATEARIHLIGGATLTAQNSAFARISLACALPLTFGDRFILRRAQPAATVGGGEVLNIAPFGKRNNPQLRARLQARCTCNQATRICIQLQEDPFGYLSEPALCRILGLAPASCHKDCHQLVSRGKLTCWHLAACDYFLLTDTAQMITDKVLSELHSFHQKNPQQPGPTKKALAATTLPWNQDLAQMAIAALLAADTISTYRDRLALTATLPELRKAHQELCQKIIGLCRTRGSTPPTSAEIAQDCNYSEAIIASWLPQLIKDGCLVTLQGNLYLARTALEQITAQLHGYFQNHQAISAADFRDLVQTSRKYAVPMLEYLDQTGVTTRHDDLRHRGPNAP